MWPRLCQRVVADMSAFLFEAKVQPDWVDYNGHMRDAYYGLVFSFAVDSFMDAIGLDKDYRPQTKATLYVVEDHRFYLDEVKEGEPLQVETFVLDSDRKRIHLYQCLQSNNKTASVCESLQLHVSQATLAQAAEMPGNVQEMLQAKQLSPREVADLTHTSGAISIRRKPTRD
jgi:acyl-CoA thioester hydrolase